MNAKTRIRPLLAALTLCLGATTAAMAIPPEGCGPRGCPSERSAGHPFAGMARLHDELKLDPKQEALWQEAERTTRASFRERGEQMRRDRQEALAALSQPGADLRAVLRRMDQSREAGRQAREADRERWLAVYDSLDGAQKEKARLFLKTRLERMGEGRRAGPGGPPGR